MDDLELANLKMELAFLEDMQGRYSIKTKENHVYVQLMIRIQELIETLETLPKNVDFYKNAKIQNLQ